MGTSRGHSNVYFCLMQRLDRGRTYWCQCHFIDKEVREPGGLSDEPLLTEGEAAETLGGGVRL